MAVRRGGKPRFVIADPSLKDGRGHHYPLTMRITESARLSGFEPVWFCHRDGAFEDSGTAHVRPTFSVALYDAYRKPAARGSGILSGVRSGVLGRLLPKRRRSLSDDDILAQQFEDGIDELGLGPDDRVLFHTADGMTYAALDRCLATRRARDLPRIHVCTPYDPAGIMPNRVAERPIGAAIARWRERGLIGDRVFLHAENARLAGHLSAQWGVPVNPLPLPVVAAPVDDTAASTVEWPHGEGEALRVVHLGPARVEKGFHLLPDIVRHTLSELGWSEGRPAPVSFLIQSTPQIVGYTPQVEKAIARLGEFPADAVRLHGDRMPEADYLEWSRTSDVFLLPYGVREYGYRSSGIVSEALSMEKIIVATADTYPASMIGPDGGLAAATPPEFGKALAAIARERIRFREGARDAGRLYCATFSAEKYVARCIAAEASS
jgi:hypothetical protein